MQLINIKLDDSSSFSNSIPFLPLPQTQGSLPHPMLHSSLQAFYAHNDVYNIHIQCGSLLPCFSISVLRLGYSAGGYVKLMMCWTTVDNFLSTDHLPTPQWPKGRFQSWFNPKMKVLRTVYQYALTTITNHVPVSHFDFTTQGLKGPKSVSWQAPKDSNYRIHITALSHHSMLVQKHQFIDVFDTFNSQMGMYTKPMTLCLCK